MVPANDFAPSRLRCHIQSVFPTGRDVSAQLVESRCQFYAPRRESPVIVVLEIVATLLPTLLVISLVQSFCCCYNEDQDSLDLSHIPMKGKWGRDFYFYAFAIYKRRSFQQSQFSLSTLMLHRCHCMYMYVKRHICLT